MPIINSSQAVREALTLFNDETLADLCFTELKKQITKSLQNEIDVNDERIELLNQLATEVYKEKVKYIIQNDRLGFVLNGKFQQCYGLI